MLSKDDAGVGMAKPIVIRDVKTYLTRPAGFNLVVVKVETSEPGLYGLGCATFTFRYKSIVMQIEEYLKPLVIGRDVANIEDIWQMLNVSSYWRNGPVTNNAISGIDMALWDIKGKLANMPLYELLGGKSRKAVPVYRYVEEESLELIDEKVMAFIQKGIKHIRIQWKNHQIMPNTSNSLNDGYYIDPKKYCLDTVKLFSHVRQIAGEEIELCHDVHERIPPSDALWLAKNLEQFRLFFLEDILSPEQGMWFKHIRGQTSVPLAQGELFTNPIEWEYLIKERMIDFLRVHMTQIGGITPSRKVAAFCEQFGVRMAWHGPPDISPIGHAANIHLDMTIHNFGIQEWPELNDLMYEIFPGAPVVEKGYISIHDKPGLGIEFNEKLAAKFPCENAKTPWIEMRLPDGTIQRP